MWHARHMLRYIGCDGLCTTCHVSHVSHTHAQAEIGDGSNFVICIAGELLSQAEELIHMGLHPSEIVAGYTKAGKKALEILDGNAGIA